MYHKYTNRQPNWTTLLDNLIGLSFISWGPCLTSLRPIDTVCLLVGTSKLKTVHLQGFWPKTVYLKCFWISVIKNRALQGFWPKTVYLKCFGIQLKTVYLQGPCSSRPCISRPCCIGWDFFCCFLQQDGSNAGNHYAAKSLWIFNACI